jgi:hypothetical protein
MNRPIKERAVFITLTYSGQEMVFLLGKNSKTLYKKPFQVLLRTYNIRTFLSHAQDLSQGGIIYIVYIFIRVNKKYFQKEQ